MRILITNDDGVNAYGLAVLERIALELTSEVWVCAPEAERSGASRSLTLSEPLRVRKIAELRTSAMTVAISPARNSPIPRGFRRSS